jgi:transcriptional regulator with XRE-family HTH domain
MDQEEGPRVLAERITLSGLAKAEVARRVGVRPQSVTNWTNGHASPELDNVRKLDGVLEAGGAILRAYGFDAGDANGACTPERAITDDPRFTAKDKDLLLRLIASFAERRSSR